MDFQTLALPHREPIPSLEQLMRTSLQAIGPAPASEPSKSQTQPPAALELVREHPTTPSTKQLKKLKIQQIITEFQVEDIPHLLEAGKKQSAENMNWKQLAQDTLGGKHSQQVCKKQYVEIQRSLYPRSTQPWSAEEDIKLTRTGSRYRYNWDIIASLIFQGTRTAEDCLERWKLLPKVHSRKSIVTFEDYDTQDDSALIAAAEMQTPDTFNWNKLSWDTLHRKYSEGVCRKRLLEIYGALNPRSTEAWSAKEDAMLQGAMRCHEKFKDIAALYFKGRRLESDCIERWMNHANPKHKPDTDPWTAQETAIVATFITEKESNLHKLYVRFQETRPLRLLELQYKEISKEVPKHWSKIEFDKFRTAVYSGEKGILSWEALSKACTKSKRTCQTLYKKAMALICSKDSTWTKEEDEALSQYLKQNSPPDWLWASFHLFPFRKSAFHCWLRARGLFPGEITKNHPVDLLLRSNYNPSNRWTEQDDQTLLDRIREVGLASWENIAAVFSNRYSPQDCEERVVSLVNSFQVEPRYK